MKNSCDKKYKAYKESSNFWRKKVPFNLSYGIAFIAFVFFFKVLLTLNNIEIKWEPGNPFHEVKTNAHVDIQPFLGTENGAIVKNPKRSVEIQQLLKKLFLKPPSLSPYNLQHDKGDVLYNRYREMSPSWIFIDSVLQDFYKDGPPGFFVEAGALDGEHLSNTLELERKLNWTGLLVEGDRISYNRLLKKNRKSWSSPLCLATKPYPHEIVLTSYNDKDAANWGSRGASRMQQNMSIYSMDGPGYPSFSKVLCVPVNQLLGALQVAHVDFFSLDVEGVEMEVLKNFPFDQITVDVWAIEHVNPNDPGQGPNATEFYLSSDRSYRYEDPNLVSFMESKGYYFFDMYCQVIPDYIFVRIKSKLFEQLAVPQNMSVRRGLCLSKAHWDPKTPADPKHLRDFRHWPSLRFNGIN